MALNTEYYGTLQEANDYFAMQLHKDAWSLATPSDRPKALWCATQIIDALNFKGFKAPVAALLEQYHLMDIPSVFTPGANALVPTLEQIREAEASQALEFPRGDDTEVPEPIRIACYELAFSLLDGRDPETELENLGIESQGYASVRTTYSRTHVPIEHIANGVTSTLAWRYLKPFLRDDDALTLSRVS